MVEQHRSLVRKLEECRSRYTDLVAAAGRQGLTEMQLMSAAVDACGPADVAAPVALDAAAARLKLLVDYVVDAPGSDAVQLLPAVWTEAEVTKLFKGEYPWRGGAGLAQLHQFWQSASATFAQRWPAPSRSWCCSALSESARSSTSCA
ncbi:hypothetical protein OEZ86_003503 [Tetradesmus obliquus]|nr:hypothetical protein OEZ86_003503 [Tetradesmus obliquus]